MRDPRIVFLLLVLVVAGSVYWVKTNSPQQDSITSQIGSRSSGINVSKSSGDVTRLDFSGGSNRSFKRPKRDLFGMLYPAPPVVKKPPVAAKPKPKPVVQAPVRIVAPPPPVPVRSTVRRMPGFQVLGSLEKQAELTAFVMLQEKIYLLKEGQEFAEEYKVASLTPDNIRIVRIDSEGEINLPLIERTGKGLLPR